jgi:hypothetical protein
MTTCEILTKAKEYIADGKNWGQFHYFVDGEKVCAIGACALVSGLTPGQIETSEPGTLLQEFAMKLYNDGITAVNDYTGLDAVLEVYNLAIARACASPTD